MPRSLNKNRRAQRSPQRSHPVEYSALPYFRPLPNFPFYPSRYHNYWNSNEKMLLFLFHSNVRSFNAYKLLKIKDDSQVCTLPLKLWIFPAQNYGIFPPKNLPGVSSEDEPCHMISSNVVGEPGILHLGVYFLPWENLIKVFKSISKKKLFQHTTTIITINSEIERRLLESF